VAQALLIGPALYLAPADIELPENAKLVEVTVG
jgi:hypothetical protein